MAEGSENIYHAHSIKHRVLYEILNNLLRKKKKQQKKQAFQLNIPCSLTLIT